MVIFHVFLSPADFFFQNHLLLKIISGIHLSVEQIDPDQARRFVGPDLGPNCLPRLSADDTRRQRVNTQRGGSWAVFAVKYV